jgi:hypothetical protein
MRLASFFILFMLVSCSNRTSVPGDVLPLDSMQVVMKDLITASEYSSQSIAKDPKIKDKTKANQELLEKIFQLHHITRATFRHSLLFYESRPDLNQQVFDSLSAYANRQQKDLYRPKSVAKPTIHPVN